MSELPDAQRLVDLHLENICDFDELGRLTVERTGGSGRPSPRFRLVLAAAAHRWFCRADIEDALAEELNALAAREPVTGTIPAWPQHREAYRDLLGASEDDEYGGPAFVLPERPLPDGRAMELGEADRPLLKRHMGGWARDFEASRPFGAVVEGGAVVSACGNARRLSAAVEAGVETVEAHRGRGYARAATAVWASAIRREGMVPLYSTSWDNVASQRIAASLGAVQYAVDYTVR